ncbi:hypothetical protein KKC_02609 [Listeria fleischmannii subsp. coloradonensis]|nr:hypothetical protein KKC_02609 [Listeria fleischmannii subsp. coloradonensis]
MQSLKWRFFVWIIYHNRLWLQTVEDVLPENLILEIQKYIDGEFLYIPVRSKKSVY